MKVLIVCSGTSGKVSPFVKEQVEALEKKGIVFEYFTINEKGISGYLKHYFLLKKHIKKYEPDLIHSHYGLSGLLANLQRKIPVITTFHGSDVNILNNLKFTKWAHKLSVASIFVEDSMMKKFNPSKKQHLIPCGVDSNIFFPIPKEKARKELDLTSGSKYVLFSSAFGNKVKNYPLAKEACDLAEKSLNRRIILKELNGYSRQQVNVLLNACDLALMTSLSEGSPQFIKEAMACNCPIVSTNVGDVRRMIGNLNGCSVMEHNVEEISKAIVYGLQNFDDKTNLNTRKRIFELNLDLQTIADQIEVVYKNILVPKTKI